MIRDKVQNLPLCIVMTHGYAGNTVPKKRILENIYNYSLNVYDHNADLQKKKNNNG